MSPKTAKRFPASVTAMVPEGHAALIEELAEQEQVSRADVLREVIKVGLPVVAKDYRQRQLKRELAELEEVVA